MDVLAEDYSTNEVCDLAGITYRQLDFWLRSGYVTIQSTASGSGSRRRFTRQEVQAISLLAQQLRLAESIQAAFNDGTLWEDCLRDAE